MGVKGAAREEVAETRSLICFYVNDTPQALMTKNLHEGKHHPPNQ